MDKAPQKIQITGQQKASARAIKYIYHTFSHMAKRAAVSSESKEIKAVEKCEEQNEV